MFFERGKTFSFVGTSNWISGTFNADFVYVYSCICKWNGIYKAIRLASSSGYGVKNKLIAVVMLVPSALMQSMSSFIAQNVGAGKEKRAQKSMGYGMLIGACIGLFMTVAAFFFGKQLAQCLQQMLHIR